MNRATMRSTRPWGAGDVTGEGSRAQKSSARETRQVMLAQFGVAGNRAWRCNPKGSRQASTECAAIESAG